MSWHNFSHLLLGGMCLTTENHAERISHHEFIANFECAHGLLMSSSLSERGSGQEVCADTGGIEI